MLRNYFTIAIRNLLKSKLYSAINIFGLSVGIGCCLILGLLVLRLSAFDRHHKNAHELYRVVHQYKNGTVTRNIATSPGALAPELKKTFPEVISATRFFSFKANASGRSRENFEETVMAVDTSFFSMFTIPFRHRTSLNQFKNKTIFISESAAAKLFGKAVPMGETVELTGTGEFEIIGVYKDFPFTSHLFGEFIIPFSVLEATQPLASSWASKTYFNYVRLPEGYDVSAFNSKLNTFLHARAGEKDASFRYYLQPLLEVYFDNSYFGNSFTSPGGTMLTSFVLLGLIILLLACFNYMNMASARSLRRATEVGVRKVMGAQRRQLIAQFMAESLILVTISFLLGILWADLGLPAVQAFLGSELEMKMGMFFSDARLVLLLLFSNLLVALIAGSYPAFFLSRFLPALVLKGKQLQDSSRWLRKTVVAVQFTLTGVFMVVAIVVFRQADYLKNKDLGFQKENLVVFKAIRGKDVSMQAFKSELQKIPGVKSIGSSSTFFGRKLDGTELRNAATPSETNLRMACLTADHDYVQTLNLKLLTGRNFQDNGLDRYTGIVLNELAAARLGWSPEEAIGKRLVGFNFSDSLPGEVIGVVANYQVASLKREMLPLVIGYSDEHNRYIVRVEGRDAKQVRDQIGETINRLIPGNTNTPQLIDEYIDELYLAELRIGQLVSFFTILAIIIGALGLYALAAYEGEQRIKELGIRKIMGATPAQLLMMLSRSFLRPVFFALLISMPLAFFVANLWLHTFAYRMPWSPTIFIIAIVLMLGLGMVAIVSQGMKASNINPTDALRHE